MCDLAPFFLILVMLFPIFLLQWISTPLSTQPNTLLCRMRTEGSSRTKAYWGSFSISQEYFLGDRVWWSPKLASGYVKGMALKLLLLLLFLILRAGTMDTVLLGLLRKLTLTTLVLIPDNGLCSGCFWQLILWSHWMSVSVLRKLKLSLLNVKKTKAWKQKDLVCLSALEAKPALRNPSLVYKIKVRALASQLTRG